mgnify:CR=1 FL=1
MNTKNIERYLNSFGKYIIKQARTNLSKGKKNVNNELYNSLKFTVTKKGGDYSVNFYMLDYGTFVDKGVSGTNQQQSYKSYEGKTINSPYKYTTKQPPSNMLAKWISKRGIKGRDKKSGRFISNLSLAFIMGRKIKRDGIKGISFFQRPLQLGLKKFGGEILKSIKTDLVNSVTQNNS